MCGNFSATCRRCALKPSVSAFVLPAQFYLFGSVTEDGTEPVPYPHLVTEFFFDRDQPHLRDVCPYAQHIGKAGYFNFVHFKYSVCVPNGLDIGFALLDELWCKKVDLGEVVIDLGQGPKEWGGMLRVF